MYASYETFQMKEGIIVIRHIDDSGRNTGCINQYKSLRK